MGCDLSFADCLKQDLQDFWGFSGWEGRRELNTFLTSGRGGAENTCLTVV